MKRLLSFSLILLLFTVVINAMVSTPVDIDVGQQYEMVPTMDIEIIDQAPEMILTTDYAYSVEGIQLKYPTVETLSDILISESQFLYANTYIALIGPNMILFNRCYVYNENLEGKMVENSFNQLNGFVEVEVIGTGVLNYNSVNNELNPLRLQSNIMDEPTRLDIGEFSGHKNG